MLRSILFLLLMCSSVMLFAQKEGTIQYTIVNQLNFEAPEGMEEMFKNMPKERSSKRELLFTSEEGLFRNVEDKIGNESDEVSLEDEGIHIKMNFNEPEETLYTNLAEGKTIHQRDLFGKTFLVTGTPEKMNWKVGKGKKKIADYICMEATTMQDDTVQVVAWFTPQIPISMGPEGFGGLPGMILQVDIDGGNTKITASEVSLESPDAEGMVAPSKGKKVDHETFIKIREEKLKEMNAQGGGRGIRIIEHRG
ncbi:MAG: GLPGLI family protein [Bacteroidia bacterium]|nr:GLPGLI family protein [Bacteroidia bacterium]